MQAYRLVQEIQGAVDEAVLALDDADEPTPPPPIEMMVEEEPDFFDYPERRRALRMYRTFERLRERAGLSEDATLHELIQVNRARAVGAMVKLAQVGRLDGPYLNAYKDDMLDDLGPPTHRKNL